MRSLVGACFVKHLYQIPTWTHTAALVGEHVALRDVLGAAPSVFALYRFSAKLLRRHESALEASIRRVMAGIREEDPLYGCDLAADASDLPAWSNGMGLPGRDEPLQPGASDPDASWGHRSAVGTRKGGGFFGHKIHLAVCAHTELPVAWQIETASRNESLLALPLLDAVFARGFQPQSLALDRQYDSERNHAECEARHVRPVIPLNQRGARVDPANPYQLPTCSHGTWVFSGSDFHRKRAKYRCPTGQCRPGSTWLHASRLHTLIPRGNPRWSAMYNRRGAVERAFSRLKIAFALLPLRVRRLERVSLHANLAVLTMLMLPLVRLRAGPQAA